MSAAISKPPPPKPTWPAPAPEIDALLAQQYAALLLRDLRNTHAVSAPPPSSLPEPVQLVKPREEPVVRLAGLLARERSGAGAPVQQQPPPAREGTQFAQVAVVDLDPLLRVRNLNAAAARVLGVAPAAARGLKLASLLRPEDPGVFGPALLERLAEGEPLALTLSCTAHDGRRGVVEWTCLPEIGTSGKLTRVRVLLRDNAARAAALEAVRRAGETR
jgi:PAS domain-containing protein